MTNKSKKIAIGLSGGVDSAVSAWLLQQQGYEVIGLFMHNWHEPTQQHCHASHDLADAQNVANQLDIELHILDFSDEYMTHVFKPFIKEYQLGLTPNPDVLCNQWIKYGCLLEASRQYGASALATGHYAKKVKYNNREYLARPRDLDKDQTYFLSLISEEQLQFALFPLENMTKKEVRDIAETQGLSVAKKKDSTGICFIGERHFKSFLSDYIVAKPGNILNEHGDIIGQHDGCVYFTIGQRKGIDIGGLQDSNGQPWYVARKNMQDNTVTVVQGKNHPMLFHTQLICEQPERRWDAQDLAHLTWTARIRHRGQLAPCRIEVAEHKNTQFLVTFEQPQRAITPGQTVCFYVEDRCIAGAKILEVVI